MSYLHLTILFPFFGFFSLSILHTFLKIENLSIFFGVFFIFLTFFISVLTGLNFLRYRELYNYYYEKFIFNLISIYDFNIPLKIILDNISLVMLLLTSSIGLLIFLYSLWFYKEKKYDCCKILSYLSFFLFGMLIIILSGNMVITYFGWEIVGLCSYFLISFNNLNKKNSISAMKAYFITKLSDFFLLTSIFIFFKIFRSFDFKEIQYLVINNYEIFHNCFLLKLSIFMIILSCMIKSAQFPFHIWLINAMNGPIPASALIHSSTMIVIGVYFLIRVNFLFLIEQKLFSIVSIFGLITIIFGSICASFQDDIKKILAYSTISQIGYMFLGIGLKCLNSVIFHLVNHSFFKALIFLLSGFIIKINNGEQNIFKINFYRKNFLSIFTYICFLISLASLASFPIFTSGFYSKENILEEIFNSGESKVFYLFSLFGVFLTVFYVTRMIYLISLNFKNSRNFQYKSLKNDFFYFFPILIFTLFSTFFGSFLIRFFLKSIFLDFEKNLPIYTFRTFVSIFLNFFGFIIFIILNKKIFNFLEKNRNFLVIKNIFLKDFKLNEIYSFIFFRPLSFFLNFFKIDYIKYISFYIEAIFIFLKKFFLRYVENKGLSFHLTLILFNFFLILFFLGFKF